MEAAKIYRKECSRPLTQYQKQVNEEAIHLALNDPSLLNRRGELMKLAQSQVYQKGYQFLKGKSRSKRFASPTLEGSERPKRGKVSAEIRQKRIAALEEEIENVTQQLHFKEKRRIQAESIRNYKQCEEITEEIRIVTKQKRELSEELSMFREKERKAMWYQKSRKRRQSATNVASDESDFPQSSPSSSIASTSANTESIHIESDTDSDDQTGSVFPLGLPADNEAQGGHHTL